MSNTTDAMTTGQSQLTSWPQVKHHWRHDHKSNTTDVMTTGQTPLTSWPQVKHHWRHDHRSNTTDAMTTSQTQLTSWPQVKHHWRNEHKSSTTDVMTTGQTPLPSPTPRVKVYTNPPLASKFHRLVHYNCPEFLYLIKSESHDMAGIKIKNKQNILHCLNNSNIQ